MPLLKELLDRMLSTSLGEDAYKVVETLTDAGFDTWWVGGCVRDMLQNQSVHEMDIGTAAEPDRVLKLFKPVDTSGKVLGSVKVRQGAHVFEVTTFRQDDEASDGRRPETVIFGTREEDARRRDFTVNALYLHPIRRELFDPFGGEEDLKERLVRFIGDAALRIRHDALRILRAVRLRAKLQGQYHPETYQALHEQAAFIEHLSGSRVLGELEKMLFLKNPDRAFEDLWELGILERILPELHACKGIPQPADYHHEGDVWEHILRLTRAFRDEDDIDVRLASVFHDCGKVETFSLRERIRFDHHATVSAELTAKALDRLQVPGKRRDKICWVIRHHMMMGSFLEMPDGRKAHWYYHPWFGDLLRLFWLDIAGTDPAEYKLYNEIVHDFELYLNKNPLPKKPLLSGSAVMELLGIPSGERVGEALKLLHEAQVKGEITTKKEAKEFLRLLPSPSRSEGEG